jgi:tetratricopeptide (TPR) repeat protein
MERQFLPRRFFGWLLLVLTLALSGTGLRAQDTGELLRQGDAALRGGKKDQAFQLMVKAMSEARKSRQTNLFLQAANCVALLGLDDKVNYDSAFALTREAVRTVAFSANDTSLANLYFSLARFHKGAYEADEAIRYFNQAASVFEHVQPGSLSEANCYHGLADVYKFTVYNFQLAEEYYERALGIREKRKITDTLTLFNNYYGLAATNRSQKDFEKAVSYGTVAVALSQSLNIVRQEYAQSMIANVYRDMGNLEQAKRSYQEALRLNGTTGITTARASHYQNMGETMFDDSLYDEALRYFSLAEQLYYSMKNKDERLFLTMLNRKATTYMEKGDSSKFEEAIEQIFGELKRTGQLRSAYAAEAYLIIAEQYGRKEKYYSALDQCQRALVASIPKFTSLDTKDNPTATMIGTNFYSGEILATKGEYLSRLYRATQRSVYLQEALTCLYLAEQLLS